MKFFIIPITCFVSIALSLCVVRIANNSLAHCINVARIILLLLLTVSVSELNTYRISNFVIIYAEGKQVRLMAQFIQLQPSIKLGDKSSKYSNFVIKQVNTARTD